MSKQVGNKKNTAKQKKVTAQNESKTEKLCRSCCGPLSEFPEHKMHVDGFCPYCVNNHGTVQSFDTIFEGMISYIKKDHKEIVEKDRVKYANKWLKEGEFWGSRYVSDEVIIDTVRVTNIDKIPNMDEGKCYDCKKCLYYMNSDTSKKVRSKKRWFLDMEEKYGFSCALILYYKTIPVGYSQFCHKSEFIKLEDYEKDSTKSDVWYISCLAILKEYQGKGLGKILLNESVKYLKANKVKKIQACGQIKGDAGDVSGGYWSMYEKCGFKEISMDEDFVVGQFNAK